MASSEQVIELSVDDTNRLRAELGLAPLRGVSASAGESNNNSSTKKGAANAVVSSASAAANNGEEEVLEMSVEDTNALRERLGLPPLKTTSSVNNSSSNKEQHAPAVNQGQMAAAAQRVETQKLKRQVEEGLRQFNPTSLAAQDGDEDNGEGKGSLLSWAQQMRSSSTDRNKEAKTPKSKNKMGTKKKAAKSSDYGETDLQGLNVAHSLGDLEGGSTTVLTLADTELLKVKDDVSNKAIGLNDSDEAQLLENVNLAEQQKQRDGLKEKRRMEMGMGRAGGYAGYDDEEFVELGGTQGPSRSSREERLGGEASSSKRKRKAGFQIGAMLEEQEQEESDLFAGQKGKAISLDSSAQQEQQPAGDFMTVEEDEAMNQAKKKKKKDAKFKKSKKKKDKKEKKKHKRRAAMESDEEDEDVTTTVVKRGNMNNLVAELEQTAKAGDTAAHLPRKRRPDDEEEDNDERTTTTLPGLVGTSAQADEETQKRSKYAAIMEKGNERTRLAFQGGTKKQQQDIKSFDDEEPDDAFLNAALSKARRLNRLKQMATASANVRGEDAVLEMVRSTKVEAGPSVGTTNGPEDEKKMVFAVDETREFTRALRAREDQNERKAKAIAKKEETLPGKEEPSIPANPKETIAEKQEEEAPMEVDEASMNELAKEIKDEPEAGDVTVGVGGLDGTGSAVTIGRGLGGVLSMLKQTGEITKNNAGREQQRGRARDERTYDDYDALDLKTVVQLDERTATEKDRELASREIKLEYRDSHGRLLTRKEAFRDLSYQFHGYGSGKRKQEKKLQQIAQEQAEQRLSSRQDGGILGALKTTQKATGKAFVVHKTS